MVGLNSEDFVIAPGKEDYIFNFPLKMIETSDFEYWLLKSDNTRREEIHSFEQDIGMSYVLVENLYSFLVGTYDEKNPEISTISLSDGITSELRIYSTHIPGTYFVFKKTYGEGYGLSKEFWLCKNHAVNEIKLRMGFLDEKIFGCAVVRIETEFPNPFNETERVIHFISINILKDVAGGMEYLQGLHLAGYTWSSYNFLCSLCGGQSYHPDTCKKCDEKMPTIEEALKYESLKFFKQGWEEKFLQVLASGNKEKLKKLNIVSAEIILDEYQQEDSDSMYSDI